MLSNRSIAYSVWIAQAIAECIKWWSVNTQMSQLHVLQCIVLQNRTAESTCHIMWSMWKLDLQMLWHRYVISVCPRIVPLVCETSFRKSSTVRELACLRKVQLPYLVVVMALMGLWPTSSMHWLETSPMTENQPYLEWEGIHLVYGWSTMSYITDMCSDLQPQSSEWLV